MRTHVKHTHKTQDRGPKYLAKSFLIEMVGQWGWCPHALSSCFRSCKSLNHTTPGDMTKQCASFPQGVWLACLRVKSLVGRFTVARDPRASLPLTTVCISSCKLQAADLLTKICEHWNHHIAGLSKAGDLGAALPRTILPSSARSHPLQAGASLHKTTPVQRNHCPIHP